MILGFFNMHFLYKERISWYLTLLFKSQAPRPSGIFEKDFEAKIQRFQMGTLCRAVHLNKKTIFGKEESDVEANDASAVLANLRDLYIQPRTQTKPCHPIPCTDGLSFRHIEIILQTLQWMGVPDHLLKPLSSKKIHHKRLLHSQTPRHQCPASLDIIWAPIWQMPSGALGITSNSLTMLINPTALYKEEKHRSCLHGGGSIAGSFSGTHASILLGIIFFFFFSLNHLFIWNESPDYFDRCPSKGFWEMKLSIWTSKGSDVT